MNGAAQAQAQAMAAEEEELLIPADLILQQMEGGETNQIDNALVKLLLYWILIVVSALTLTYHLFADDGGSDGDERLVPKNQYPTLAMFVVFLCAICLMFRAIK